LIFPQTDADYICSHIEEVKDSLRAHGTVCLKNISFNEEELI
jgi:alpha-ketoglutarate-dependent taurine dioxygenase